MLARAPSRFPQAARPGPFSPALSRLRSAVLLGAALGGPLASAQSTGSQGTTAAPAAPAAQPTTTQPATTQPGAGALSVSSALAVEVSGAVKGRLVDCPRTLKLGPSAVCLYTKNTLPALRSVLRGKFSGRVVSDWKTSANDKTSSLVVRAAAQDAFVLLAQLNATDSLVVVDTVKAAARPAVTVPAGVVKGQRYVLDSDLRGLVNVASLSSTTFRMAPVGGGQGLTVVSGKKTATVSGGTVELPLAPVSDGKNLLFPLDGLRALGCTVTPAQVGVTVACGGASANVRPIVF